MIINAKSGKQNLRRYHPNYPNIVEKVVKALVLATFTIGPALLFALATESALIALVWFLANDAIGAAFGVISYRRATGSLPTITPAPAIAPISNRFTLKKAA